MLEYFFVGTDMFAIFIRAHISMSLACASIEEFNHAFICGLSVGGNPMS